DRLLVRHRLERSDWHHRAPLDVARHRIALAPQPVRRTGRADLLRATRAGIVVGAVLVLGDRLVVVARDVLRHRLVVLLLHVLGHWLVVAALNVADAHFRLRAGLWARLRTGR